jgi:hypothetical protein
VVSRSIHALRSSLLSVMLMLFPLSPARADLVLNEVLYDPSGADEGNEFVELWNPDRVSRALAGVSIEVADGAKPDVWTVLFRGSEGDSVAPASAFLVSASALAGPIQNGPDAMRLSRAGVVLDRLGYGDLNAASLYEGAPAPDVASGHSLARLTDGLDSDRNADDWGDEPSPTPGRANHPDERLELSPDGVRIEPAVPWPGETAVARAWVRNRGRLALAASKWEIAAEQSSPAAPSTHAAPRPVAIRGGVSLAAGDSTLVELPFDAGAAGTFSLLVRVGPVSPDAGVGDDAPELKDSVWVSGRVLASPAVIHEIAFRDAGAGEWVELWMREPIVDVGELLLADASSAPRRVERGPDPRPLAAGAFLVLAQNPAAVRARFGLDSTFVLGLVGGWPALNDTDNDRGVADVIRLFTEDGTPSDVVPYSSRASSRGGTLERLSPDLPGHLPGTWGESVDPVQATPGRPNSLRAPARPPGQESDRGALLLASARVLRRGEGAPLLLRTTPDASGRELVIEVFDLLGRSVRTLVDGQRFESEAAFAWDGRDSNGNWVNPGLYVVAARATAEHGRGPRDSAIPVAVSAAGAHP